MPAASALIAAWARSAVVPKDGAFGMLGAHELAAPVVQALLARAGISPLAVDAVALMESRRITSVLVVDESGRLCGAVNSNDLLRAKVI